MRVGPGRRGRMAVAAAGALGLLALSIGSLFVKLPARPVAAAVAVGEAVTPARPQNTAGFPAVAAFPVRTTSPETLTISSSLRMRRGNGDNLLSLEILAPEAGAVALSVTSATVVSSWVRSRGVWTVALESTNGYTFEYSNLAQVWVKAGQIVAYGEPIGVAAPFGPGNGSLLWFEVRTGQRYFERIRMHTRGLTDGPPWTLELGPEDRVALRRPEPGLTLQPSVEEFWFPAEATTASPRAP